MRLTEAGRVLLVQVRAVLNQLEQARAEMLALAGAGHGCVTVGAPATIDAWRLTEALAAFHQRFPHGERRIQDGDTAALVGLLDRGIVDLALATLPVPARGLWVRRLLVEELVVAVSRTHRLTQVACIDFAALAGEPLLLAPPGADLREIALDAC